MAVGVIGIACTKAHADSPESADMLKADRLLNFLKFVVWPSAVQTEPLGVCFLGAEAVQNAFERDLSQKHVGLHPLKAHAVEAESGLQNCQVLYIDATWRAANPAHREPLLRQMLTVSDSVGFTEHGGMIGITVVGDHLRFTVNVENFRRAGLRVSSSLLEVATIRR